MSDATDTQEPTVTDAQEAIASPGSPEVSAQRNDTAQSNDSEPTDTVLTPSQLEEEGDIAADYIEELLDITDLDGDIEIDARGGRAYLSVTSSQDTSLRLLSRPDTVNALQELTRIAVQTKTGAFSRLILDIGGSRETREAELALLVDKAVERIEAGAESASLPAMSSYERKLVHDVVAERGFTSQSEGEGRDRHTVVTRS